jgi:hypothetical protein
MSPDPQKDTPGTLKALLQDLPETMREDLWEAFCLLIQEMASTWEQDHGVNVPQGWAIQMMAEDAAEKALLRLGCSRLSSPLFWDLYQGARHRRLSVAKALKEAAGLVAAWETRRP